MHTRYFSGALIFLRTLDLAANSNVQDAFVIAVEQQARERLERLSALKRIKPVDMTKLSKQLNQIPTTDHQKEINGFIEKSPIYVTSINSEYKSNNNNISNNNNNNNNNTSSLKSDRGSKITIDENNKGERGLNDKGIVLDNDNKSDDIDVTSELELKQDLNDEKKLNKVFDNQTRTCSGVGSVSDVNRHSPFENGRTEVLIGQDGNSLLRTTNTTNTTNTTTTAVVENNRLLIEDPDVQLR
ncbi:conserved hypothetical protein [Pediculus humanus corporis]|uniref:Uncharacterized protein n=1 Tax=Pediculus humanus subsp. corporis TaxID=121224 RepID=E0VLG0_PEDHC|nr:uncharacterized protein Phum_PHUM287320 [Pediculus humanus corporis]EEB14216.1 conserved hypothetical protein [Pediculus humanus corporis]